MLLWQPTNPDLQVRKAILGYTPTNFSLQQTTESVQDGHFLRFTLYGFVPCSRTETRTIAHRMGFHPLCNRPPVRIDSYAAFGFRVTVTCKFQRFRTFRDPGSQSSGPLFLRYISKQPTVTLTPIAYTPAFPTGRMA